MFSLFASFVDGKLSTGSSDNQLLFLAIILGIGWFLLGLIVGYYFFQFKFASAKAKIFGWPLIGTIIGLSLVMLLCWILNIIFYVKAESIFESANTALNIVIALFVIGYGSLATTIVLLWVLISKFGVGFDEEKMFFIGEKIMYNKITKVIKDEKKGALYVNFAQGKRTYKRQKFSLKSVIGQFVFKNIELSGHKIEVADEDEYFKNIASNKTQSEDKTSK